MPVHIFLGALVQAAISLVLNSFATMGNTCSSSLIDFSWSTAIIWLIIICALVVAFWFYKRRTQHYTERKAYVQQGGDADLYEDFMAWKAANRIREARGGLLTANFQETTFSSVSQQQHRRQSCQVQASSPLPPDPPARRQSKPAQLQAAQQAMDVESCLPVIQALQALLSQQQSMAHVAQVHQPMQARQLSQAESDISSPPARHGNWRDVQEV